MGMLDGKIAVITGGAAGIGLATAKLFASEGATVVIADYDQTALATCMTPGSRFADAIYCDISKVADLDALRDRVKAAYGRVDVLFANAGSAKPNLIEKTSEADFDFTADINFKGTFFTVQKLAPLMPPGSSVILNTSIQGAKPVPGLAVYGATKAAIRALAKSFMIELSDRGIRTNAVAPGFINTDLRRHVGLSEELILADDLRAQTQVPLKRIGEPHDIAQAVLFLASDGASYITGVELFVDGGTAQI
ncbi:MAG TPA: SDR family oxidoreductase [Lacipirellulaceae bacterium]|nr:SDR family oxidoreductase [Lacipirellulaceae bacterium]